MRLFQTVDVILEHTPFGNKTIFFAEGRRQCELSLDVDDGDVKATKGLGEQRLQARGVGDEVFEPGGNGVGGGLRVHVLRLATKSESRPRA
jgi:hypothetical protein